MLYAYVDGNRCTHEGNEGNTEEKKITVTFALIAIYAQMIYTAPCIMFWLRANPLRGQVGGWALEIESFMGPVKWHRADRRVPFGAQKTRTVQASTGSCYPDTSSCISGPYGVDMYRRAQLVSDFIEASRNFFSLKIQPKIFEN